MALVIGCAIILLAVSFLLLEVSAFISYYFFKSVEPQPNPAPTAQPTAQTKTPQNPAPTPAEKTLPSSPSTSDKQPARKRASTKKHADD